LLIYRIRASHIGLVQLQDKIVVRFALTIYPYSLEERRAGHRLARRSVGEDGCPPKLLGTAADLSNLRNGARLAKKMTNFINYLRALE